MTLTQIQYVLAVAETGTISAAAKRLFIAQPSLTASIKELENELQVTLFRPHEQGRDLNAGGRGISRLRAAGEQPIRPHA